MRFPPTGPAFRTLVAVAASALLTGCAATTGSAHPTPAADAGPGPASSAAPTSDYEAPVVAGVIRTPGIKESSGLSASECQDVLWTHNDSGNDALIYALSTSGGSLGTWRVEGTRNTDWESIATYKDPSGRCSLIIGDIGDNDENRGEVEIYRVPEPLASTETASSSESQPLSTEPAETMRLTYPDGSNNAETLLVHPWTGNIYVVTKKESGPAGVYRVAPTFGAVAPAVGEHVADVTVPSKPEGLLTGGSISPDGRRVMLCDLKAGYELVLPQDVSDPDAIWRQEPSTVDLGDRKQGEGVSYARDGLALFASSEKKNAPLYLITRR